MEHLLIIIELFSLFIGTAALAISAFVNTRFPSQLLKLLIYFQAMMGLIIGEQVLSAYMLVNNIQQGAVNDMVKYLSWIGTLGLIYIIPKMGYTRYDLERWKHNRLRYFILMIFSLCMFPIYLWTHTIWSIGLANLPLFYVIIDTVMRVGKHYQSIQNPIEQKLINRLGILSVISVPLIFLDTKTESIDFLNRWFPYGLLSTPMFFSIFNGLLIHALWQYMQSESFFVQQAPQLMDQSLPMIWGTFGLTPREQEVADCLFKGLTYPEIAVQLTVSLGTVKTHVKSIYQKAQVTTKVELIHKVAAMKNGTH